MSNVIPFPSPKIETVVDQLNRMDSETLDQVLLTLFETNEKLAVDISRGIEIIQLDKAICEGEFDYD